MTRRKPGKSGGGTVATSTSPAYLLADNLARFDVRDYDYLVVVLAPATQALTAILAAFFPNRAIAGCGIDRTASGDYSSPVWPIDKASSGVYTLAAAAVGYLRFEVRGIDTVTIAVTAASAGTCAYSYRME